ncbi:MAG: uroporphyrinogen-III C-methyltransferase [Deltaproteobacteria bacterium]|nr:uroporphyrinogen-III C-methyltransferase [Deltaproteobacteria bacterium]MBW2084896.1 uroporphyrinogen-III C-methyltransferase [Deltaproteobacteria bacterium]
MNERTGGKGKVYLVGAGPGDPGLITLKALECLRQADVVVYDFLASPALLRHVPPEAELVYAGKKGAQHTLNQEEINQLIVTRANEGRTVVRLKGGDPFIFGRGGEEAEELARAGVSFEVVPGVTSAIAAPAYAGIPLTHRKYASSVGFVTGHEDPSKPESALDWDRIASGLDTLVFLMGVRNLPVITAQLIQAGRDAATPAALIRWGATPDQATLEGTLADIASRAEAQGLKPPAVLVVGEVVRLRSKLNWFETLPLFGRTIMVTRTRRQASVLTGALSGLGAKVMECPLIRLVPPDDWGPVDKAIDDLTEFDWLILTSPNGVEFLFRRLFERGKDARSLAPVRLAVIGPATAEKLGSYGLRADLVPEEYVAEGLAKALISVGISGQKVLLARAAQARAALAEELFAARASVREVTLYQTLPPEDMPPEARLALEREDLDVVAFTSSSTVTNLVELLGDRTPGLLSRVRAACIGPITARTAREAGLNVVAEAKEYTVRGLVAAIKDYCHRSA